jgi:peptidoglycan LD-endopeptidase LytH
MRAFRGWLVAIALLGAIVPASASDVARAGDGTDQGTAEDAAREIAAARERANAAADAWSQAQSKVELLSDEKNRLDAEVEKMEAQVAELKATMETVAVNRYIGVGTTGLPILTGNQGPTEQAQTAVLVGIINEEGAITFDDYNSLLDQLADKRAKAEETTKKTEAAQKDFENKQQAALDEIERLKAVERDRLNDEAVQRALEAQRQKEIEASEKLAAEQLKKDQDAAAVADLAIEGGGSDGGDEGQGVITGNQVSGSSSGGSTGGGGSGGRPVGGVGIIYGQGEDWVCPLQGGYVFADTWGAPRSGGRTHQGTDMIATRGTPIVAVVDGVATPKSNTLGGTTISFLGVDGNRYYYAHLDSYANLGPVVKGTVIGYVGDTGNAKFSTPHLHFELHPGGGAAVNPYPTIAANC